MGCYNVWGPVVSNTAWYGGPPTKAGVFGGVHCVAQDIRDFTRTEWCSALAAVSQEPVLFPASIAYNIGEGMAGRLVGGSRFAVQVRRPVRCAWLLQAVAGLLPAQTATRRCSH